MSSSSGIPSSSPVSDDVFTPFSDGGFTPWELENQDLFSFFFQQSDQMNHSPVNSNSGSDEPNHMNRSVCTLDDERKKKRMVSNRESAKRSRMRKQKHLEDLRNQLNRLRVQNRDLANRLQFVNQYGHILRNDNDRLRFESEFLRHRLSDIRRILIFRQLQPLISSSSPSLMA